MTVRYFDGHEPLQLVVVSEIDDAENSFSQDSFHAVATDALQCLSGSFIHGFRLERAGLAEVVHGQSSYFYWSPNERLSSYLIRGTQLKPII
jgi:hypothetical protein